MDDDSLGSSSFEKGGGVTRIKTLDTDCHALCSLSYTLTLQYCNHVHMDNYD